MIQKRLVKVFDNITVAYFITVFLLLVILFCSQMIFNQKLEIQQLQYDYSVAVETGKCDYHEKILLSLSEENSALNERLSKYEAAEEGTEENKEISMK